MEEAVKRQVSSHDEIADAFPEIAEEHAAGEPAGEDPRLYGDLREETRVLALLHDVSQELTAILEREALLGAVARRVSQIVDYQLFTVMLWNEEKQMLEADFSLRFDERIQLRTTLPLNIGLCGTAAAERRPVRVGRVAHDPRYVRCDCDSDVDVRSELVVPLIAKGKIVGVLDLESTRENAFSECDETTISTLAPTIAIALENARLYEQVREGEQRLAEDLARAREVQELLLPAATPNVPGLDIAVGYRPARELGGDFYDFLRYGDGRIGVAVGDVAGKGTAAALYGSLGVGMLREHAIAHPCPAHEMLEHLNERLHHSIAGRRGEGRFIALVFGIYDEHTQRLELANSGFPRPLLLRSAQPESIPVIGVPLGLLPGTKYDPTSLQLQHGDVLVFCSDGIHECCNDRAEEFGKKQLSAELLKLARDGSAQAIADGLLEATDCYGPAGDDRTVVVLRVK
jgi:sigma-B regulation protein RsbU (phosphoserine phosphatase)